MGERKAVNKYFPPDYDPRMGSLDKYHGIHPLRERAKKIHEGILVIRFEMPYNIWCNGCEKHIGMGVRYNAEKQKVGKYYTTPIYKFRMKCHLCDQYFEIRTDPKNCEYEILSGCRRKEERWDTEKAGNVQTTHREEKQQMMTNAMYKLEHQAVDEGKVKKLAPTLGRLQEIRDVFDDDFHVNQYLRKQFREEKKELQSKKEEENNLKRKLGLPLDFKLANETEEDKEKAKKISYGTESEQKIVSAETRRCQVKESSIFATSNNSKINLVKSLTTKWKKSSSCSSIKTFSSPRDVGIKVRSKPHKNEEVMIKRTQVECDTLPNQHNITKDVEKDEDVPQCSNNASECLITHNSNNLNNSNGSPECSLINSNDSSEVSSDSCNKMTYDSCSTASGLSEASHTFNTVDNISDNNDEDSSSTSTKDTVSVEQSIDANESNNNTGCVDVGENCEGAILKSPLAGEKLASNLSLVDYCSSSSEEDK